MLTVALNISGWNLVPLFENALIEAIIWTLAFLMLGLMIIANLTGIAYDIEKENKYIC